MLRYLSAQPDVKKELKKKNFKLVVMANSFFENLTYIPELASTDLSSAEGNRTFIPTDKIRIAVVAEENLLCNGKDSDLSYDPNAGEGMLVHAFAGHTMKMGASSQFSQRV